MSPDEWAAAHPEQAQHETMRGWLMVHLPLDHPQRNSVTGNTIDSLQLRKLYDETPNKPGYPANRRTDHETGR